MAIRQEVNTPLIVTIGVVSAMLLLVATFGLEAWFAAEQNAVVDQRWREHKQVELEQLRARQVANLERRGWVDPDQKTQFAVPIDQAMKLVLENKGKLPAGSAPAPAPAGGAPGGAAPGGAAPAGGQGQPAPGAPEQGSGSRSNTGTTPGTTTPNTTTPPAGTNPGGSGGGSGGNGGQK